jgi:hypothetical protein
MASAPQKQPGDRRVIDNVAPLSIPPGVNRDATVLASDRWVDAQWVRWFRGRWAKMLGYIARQATLLGPIRYVNMFWQNALGYTTTYSVTAIQQFTINASGTVSAVSNRTPAGFTSNVNNNWQVDVMFNEASGDNSLIAHCTENLADPGSGTERPIYYGDITATSVLATTGKSVDGGIVVLQPYLVGYGSNGYVAWSDANQPTVWTGGDSGEDNVTGTKVLKGLRTRGGGNQISGLLWSQDSLIKMQYVGGDAIFAFQIISAQITVLSTAAIIEYEGRFFWPGVDHWYVYDGTVRTLPNDLNMDWFYDNLNFAQRQKVWASAVPHFGEIWWHFPSGAATECDKAVIFNVAETARTGQPVWYDTESARSAGSRPNDFPYPLWSDTAETATVYQHEVGVDAVSIASASTAIEAYAQTNVITAADAGLNNWTEMSRVEPDFKEQDGDIELEISGRQFARSTPASESWTITSVQEKQDLLKQYRQMQFKWTSNVVGGYFESGKILIHPKVSDAR